eukprot:4922110-Prymnesium_polylepis.1
MRVHTSSYKNGVSSYACNGKARARARERARAAGAEAGLGGTANCGGCSPRMAEPRDSYLRSCSIE